MQVSLSRLHCLKSGIFGQLKTDLTIYASLERAYLSSSGAWVPKIPNGLYICKRRWSQRHNCDLFGVLDVPECEDIEIHVGDYNTDSDGCILIGRNIELGWSPPMITKSSENFKQFMQELNGLDEFVLIVN